MKVQVEIEIPDDCEIVGNPQFSSAMWDHAADEIPKHGAMGFCVRIREKWQWPNWLKVSAIAMDECGDWWTFSGIPACDEQSHQWRGSSLWIIVLSDLDFTTPHCTDWRKSLRLNPNLEAKQ